MLNLMTNIPNSWVYHEQYRKILVLIDTVTVVDYKEAGRPEKKSAVIKVLLVSLSQRWFVTRLG